MSESETILLASSSVTRAAMLKNAGIKFLAESPLVNETALKQSLHNTPDALLARLLAETKSRSLARKYPDALIIGSDQTLISGDKLIDKAGNLSAAREILRALRGQYHTLQSAVCVSRNDEVLWAHEATATLKMHSFSDQFLETYVELEGNQLLTTVGAYRIEGRGIQLFDSIVGDHYVILGMPLLPLLMYLRNTGAIAK
jgi:septum formation protein